MRLKERLANLLRAFSFPVFVLSGTGRYGGGELRILYAGSDPFRHYLKTAAFVDNPREEFRGRSSLAGLNKVKEEFDLDLAIIRGHVALTYSRMFESSIFVPEWLAGETSLTKQRQHERSSKSRQRDRKLFERHGLSFAVTTDPKDLIDFYENMYLPHIQSAHQGSALLMSRDSMLHRAKLGEGELIKVMAEEQAVAGSFIVYDAGQPRLFSAGVLNRDKELLRKGVGTAIYLFSFDHLAEQGFDSVQMGRSRGFLSDGGIYFKRRFGLTLNKYSESGVFIRPLSARTALRNFMGNTGFVHVRRGQLMASVFPASGAFENDPACQDQKNLAIECGIDDIEINLFSHSIRPDDYLISKVKVAHKDS